MKKSFLIILFLVLSASSWAANTVIIDGVAKDGVSITIVTGVQPQPPPVTPPPVPPVTPPPVSGQYTHEVRRAFKASDPFNLTGGQILNVGIRINSITYFLLDPKGFGFPYMGIAFPGKTAIVVRIEDTQTINPAGFNLKILELDTNDNLINTWTPQSESSGMYVAMLKGFTQKKYDSGVKFLLKVVEMGIKDTIMNVKWW